MKALYKECRECMWATAFVVLLLVMTAASWWFALIGTNPFHPVAPAQLFDVSNQQVSVFRRGDWAYVKNYVCVDNDVFATTSNALYDTARHAQLSVGSTSSVVPKGCTVRGTAFRIPAALPPGTYEFRTVSRFQNNLIGRDQSNTFLPVTMRITE